MKTILLIIFIGLGFCTLLPACKKEDKGSSAEEIQTKRIEEIIPARYLDTLKNLGLTIYSGTTPPDIQGIHVLAPIELENSNVPGDVIGHVFHDAKLKLFNQSNEDFSIQMYSKYFVGTVDTSITTAVSGSGNNFTVYGKVKATTNSNYAQFAIILSGTKTDDHFSNVKVGTINIDNTHGGSVFIKQGQGRTVYESDYVSETDNTFRTLPAPSSFVSLGVAH